VVLIDTNVLLDLVTDDPIWADWSIARLEEAALVGRLAINDVVYAELSVRYDRIEDLDIMLKDAAIESEPMPKAALFLAGKAFAQYRQAGGRRSGVLPDFFIGAHAAILGQPLLTRDDRRYRSYFPTLELIAPIRPANPSAP
jgi:predicted nucleic acid-binding protein